METKNNKLAEPLLGDCQLFLDCVQDLSETQFSQHAGDKWSIAEVMQHLYLSARPVARLMMGPREVFVQWGLATVPSKSYDDIESAYLKIVATGVKAPTSMTPRLEDTQVGKQVIIDRFTGIYQTLADAIAGWSEQALDTYRIPHPALGQLTVREMLYFTRIHTRYHLRRLPVVNT